ncbi:hypothetical protein QW180_31645, partial [Vibrio sinaloensis]|nr:hypothetical protein [Vibrio sinaloensis]
GLRPPFYRYQSMSIKQSTMMILLFFWVFRLVLMLALVLPVKARLFHGQPFSDVSSYFAALDSCFNYYGWRRKSDASVQTNSSGSNQYVLMSTTVYYDNSCTQTHGSNRAKTIGFFIRTYRVTLRRNLTNSVNVRSHLSRNVLKVK